MPSDPHEAAILRPSGVVPHERGGGARTIPLVTRALGSERLLNGIAEFAPGGAVPLHTHDREESVLVLDGDARVEIDGTDHRMAAGDVTWVPARVSHRFVDASPAPPLRISWTHASVTATRTLVETGETRSIGAERR